MADQTLARYVNELSILTMLRTRGAATRADMARRLSITPATVTRLVSELSRRELLREIDEPATNGAAREPGRPGVSVELNSNGAYFLGVEIDVGVLRYALLDLSASVVASSEVRVPKSAKPAIVVGKIVDFERALERESRFKGKVKSVGVTVPGLVTSDGYVVNLPILGWKSLDLLAILKEQDLATLHRRERRQRSRIRRALHPTVVTNRQHHFSQTGHRMRRRCDNQWASASGRNGHRGRVRPHQDSKTRPSLQLRAGRMSRSLGQSRSSGALFQRHGRSERGGVPSAACRSRVRRRRGR